MEAVIQEKLEHASEIAEQIMSLCLLQCQSPRDRNLLRIGTYLGDFTNSLRSALNYTIRAFSESKLQPILSSSEFKEIKKDTIFLGQTVKQGLTRY